MIRVKTDISMLKNDLNNIIDYSLGFFDGIDQGKVKLMNNFSKEVKDALKEFIDASARVSPHTMHHVYEWSQVGLPEARLFDLECQVSKNGISVNGTFRQSQSIKEGSKVPFYNKAEVMENGIPVRITPVASDVLVFDDNGERVFTKKEVVVDNPGGRQTQGSFQRVFDQFFNQYFTQSFLINSKIMYHLSMPNDFVKNFESGKRVGRAAGIAAGFRWVARAGDN